MSQLTDIKVDTLDEILKKVDVIAEMATFSDSHEILKKYNYVSRTEEFVRFQVSTYYITGASHRVEKWSGKTNWKYITGPVELYCSRFCIEPRKKWTSRTACYTYA